MNKRPLRCEVVDYADPYWSDVLEVNWVAILD